MLPQTWVTIIIFALPVIGAGAVAWLVLYFQKKFVGREEWSVDSTQRKIEVEAVRRESEQKAAAITSEMRDSLQRVEGTLKEIFKDRKEHDQLTQVQLSKVQESLGYVQGQLSTLTTKP